MEFITGLFAQPPCPPEKKRDVDRLIEELIKIGSTDDYLSERPGGTFNMQCRHVLARDIGKRLHEIGGLPLMTFAEKKVKRKLKMVLASHLGYCWTDIGDWKY